MITIFEPRYHDKVLLIDIKKIPRGQDNVVKVVKKFYKGNYLLKQEVVDRLMEEKAIEHRNYKGGPVDLLKVPLEEVIKIEEEENDEWEKITTLLK